MDITPPSFPLRIRVVEEFHQLLSWLLFLKSYVSLRPHCSCSSVVVSGSSNPTGVGPKSRHLPSICCCSRCKKPGRILHSGPKHTVTSDPLCLTVWPPWTSKRAKSVLIHLWFPKLTLLCFLNVLLTVPLDEGKSTSCNLQNINLWPLCTWTSLLSYGSPIILGVNLALFEHFICKCTIRP